jgi:hypothetical protein
MPITTFPQPEIAGGGINFELISTTTITGTPAQVDFTAIDPKYRYLRLIWNCEISAAGIFEFALNNNFFWFYKYGSRSPK